MVVKLYSVLSIGLEPLLIEIEVTKSKGIPGIVIVGLSAKQAEAIKHKLIHLVQYLGYRLPSVRFVVNIAPGDISKNSTQFELPVLVGVLHILGVIKELPAHTAWIGEVSLEGKPTFHSGVVRLALAASTLGFSQLIVPQSVTAQLEPFTSVLTTKIVTIENILELIATRPVLTQVVAPQKQSEHSPKAKDSGERKLLEIWQSIRGQIQVKRAIQVAAAGRHHLLLIGPPGVGKTALAKCVSLFLPDLTPHQQLTCTVLHQEAGFNLDVPVMHPPFRYPHHSASTSALLGGGSPPKPGEINLAHHGVLFLDELGEWPGHVLESLRQPLEDAQTRVAKGRYRVTFPAESLVIAASNPCPCGYYGSENKKCRCTPTDRTRYKDKFSGPLLDRFDMIVWVPHVTEVKSRYTDLHSPQESFIPEKIRAPTQHQAHLSSSAEALLLTAQQRFNFSARVRNKITRLSQTIAFLEDHSLKVISDHHVAEALSFRPQLSFLES